VNEMGKPELLVTPTSVKDIKILANAGADAFLIGEDFFGLRLAGEFKRTDILEACKIAHQLNKKIYVAMNAIFHNEKVSHLEDYLLFLDNALVDGVVFGDPAVLMAAKEVAPNIKLHWSTETTGTNWYSCNYWGRKGAKRAVLARELSMDEIVEIKENAEVEIEVQVHGMSCMFQSKRLLVGNYFQYQGKELKVEQQSTDNKLYLYDPDRNSRYPIFEDENGTHIMSPNDICVVDELGELIDAGIDSFKIDGILKTVEYMGSVVSIFRKAIDAYIDDEAHYEAIKDDLYNELVKIQPKNRDLDTGFFFKETVY
jgi:U32 family peptidase